ncbi:MAG TPA: hypothetical protein PLC42_03635 [Parachlamydiaceae bacterium]|nr:hypothetical protein [Parachlamydiaceae bacterium]
MHENTASIPFSTLFAICKKGKNKILLVAAISFCLSLFYSITRPIEYIAEGTFRDKAKANNGLGSFAGLLTGNSAQDSNAIALMKSKAIRESTAKALNFQAELKSHENQGGIFKRISQNIAVEINKFFFPLYLSLSDKTATLSIKNVSYDKEIPYLLKLKFISEEEFEILDNNIKTAGKIEVPIIHKNYQFTLSKVGQNPLTGQIFTLQFHSIDETIQNMGKKLIVEPDVIDKNILSIKFKNEDRHLAAKTVNALMDSYKSYLKKEQNLIIDHQIQYLERRQGEIGERLKNSMESHVLKISDDIKNIGFPNTQLAMEFLTESQNSLQKKLLDIEFELKRLQNSQKTDYAYYDTYTLPGDPAVINQILSEMRGLKQQQNSLNLKLKDFKGEKAENFDGMDLKAVQDLFISYTYKLNEIEANMLQNKFLIEQLKENDFELSSLGTVLNDEIIHEMSKTASSLAMSLKDTNNRTLKEQERIKEDLNLQKKFLTAHLENTNQLLELNENLMHYKLKSLQHAALFGVKQQIHLLETNLAEYIENRIRNLKAEAVIIEQHKLSLMAQMSALPTKWVSEKLINLEMEVNQKMVEEVSKLVETKNIGSNLEIIQSTVIDAAKPPLHPIANRPFLFAILTSFLATAFTAFLLIFKSIKKEIKQIKVKHINQPMNLSVN